MRENGEKRRRRGPREAPTERAYIHNRCGEATVVSGYDFDAAGFLMPILTRWVWWIDYWGIP